VTGLISMCNVQSVYTFPLNAANRKNYDKHFASFGVPGGSETWWSPLTLRVYGHDVLIPRVIAGRRVAMFSFSDICENTLGAADYIDIAERFSIVFLHSIPILSLGLNRNEIRRMITLIDALYEASVRVIFLADAGPMELLVIPDAEKQSGSNDEMFAFDRTVSRLLEMQSAEYWSRCSESRPVGVDFLVQSGVQINSLTVKSEQPKPPSKLSPTATRVRIQFISLLVVTNIL
jgi:cell division protein ZapE